MHFANVSSAGMVTEEEATLMNSLERSRQRMRRTTADGGIALAHATAARMAAAHALAPARRDPVAHFEEAHTRARRHLARLGAHDPSREVTSFMMTLEL